jgi:4-alpha-glucanotransferase
MYASHNSRLSIYREPFGAAATETTVKISIRIEPQGESVQSVYLCYAYGLEKFHESRLRLKMCCDSPGLCKHLNDEQNQQAEPEVHSHSDQDIWFHGTCHMPAEPSLFFYWFEIQVNNSRTWLTADHEKLDGSSRFSPSRPHLQAGENFQPQPFQITVYQADFKVPDWLPGAVMYQIFPDRFHRSAAFSYKQMVAGGNFPERVWHRDWRSDVDIHGHPETGYLACDFFGGSLRGIIEKLDYIAAFGTDIIYLNPIFKARSNHRYDTGDYESIDPLLGTEDDFKELCEKALQLGIRIMLDGVFSHTGADSRYFNKLERYENPGAFQEAKGEGLSDFSSWYTFHRKGDELFYDSWWGFPDLPSVNEHDLAYRHYMTGENGIIRRWLRLGASGWRLDVSDELPDSFLRDVRKAVRAEKPDAAIMGEVWEDASRKISYGSYRDFLLGRTHDSIMGYPFRNALIGWLAKHHPAQRMLNELESVRENYPVPSFYCNMNLISSHDIPRAITAIAGLPDPGNRELQKKAHLSESARKRGEALLKLAFLFQIAYPGVAAIYYGDETAMEGYRDPFNRRTFPWGQENRNLIDWFVSAARLRDELTVLKTGFYETVLADNDIFVFRRFFKNGLNALGSYETGNDFALAMFNRSGEERKISFDGREITLGPYGGRLECGRKCMQTTP